MFPPFATLPDRGWPAPTCAFPAWFSARVWRDMSGKHLFEVSDRVRGTVQINYRKRPDSRETTTTELRCMQVLHQNDTARVFMAVSYSSVGW